MRERIAVSSAELVLTLSFARGDIGILRTGTREILYRWARDSGKNVDSVWGGDDGSIYLHPDG